MYISYLSEMTEHMMGKKSFISLTKVFFIMLERSYKKMSSV